MPALSIVIPVLDESANIRAALSRLADCRRRGVEVIVVDGGSTDGTTSTASTLADHVITAPRGRARQMNAGATAASGDAFLFLHCDCVLPHDADRLILDALAQPAAMWGRFDVRIEGRHPLLRVIAALMNVRSRLTGIATGDQAIFVRRGAFERAGHFPDIPLMEDIAFSKAMKRTSRPVCLRAKVATSGRRWEKNGVVRTMILMWRLRLAYFLGADPASLAKRYGYEAD
jgi:rSAM/selenodomain-associated transferase 2